MVACIRALESRIMGQARESAGSAIATSVELAQKVEQLGIQTLLAGGTLLHFRAGFFAAPVLIGYVPGPMKFWGFGWAFANSMDHADAGMILPRVKTVIPRTHPCTHCVHKTTSPSDRGIPQEFRKKTRTI